MNKVLSAFFPLVKKEANLIRCASPPERVEEHNIDLIKCADHVIDLGPGGGINGGQLVAEGTPEKVSKVKASYTGQYLKTKV